MIRLLKCSSCVDVGGSVASGPPVWVADQQCLMSVRYHWSCWEIWLGTLHTGLDIWLKSNYYWL
jgi:hypothetical protein